MTSNPTIRHLATCREVLASYRAVAGTLGVPLSRVRRWRGGQQPDFDDADRLAALAITVEIMGRWMGPDAVLHWLGSPNPHADQLTPSLLLRRGRFADLMDVIETEKGGAYA